jgi:hypothetical protein
LSFFGGFGTSGPECQSPRVGCAPEGHRERSTNQSRSENGDSAAQGTRKILPEYGHFTSVPGGNPRTST